MLPFVLLVIKYYLNHFFKGFIEIGMQLYNKIKEEVQYWVAACQKRSFTEPVKSVVESETA